MKVRAWAPAIAGLLLIAAVFLLVKLRGEDEPATPAKPAPTAHHDHDHDHQSPAPTATVTAKPAVKPVAETAPGETTDDDLAHKRPLSPDELKVGTPDFQPKKAKMTLDERLAEAQKHIPVIERRAELIDQEIAKLEAAGKAQQASEQRVVAKRLREHADELKKAIAERREPM